MIEIIASFWENSLLLGKFDLLWPPVTSILTSSKNDPCVFCSTLHGLSNAVYRFSMHCVVLEISRGGGGEINPPPPPVLGWLRPPAGARVKEANAAGKIPGSVKDMVTVFWNDDGVLLIAMIFPAHVISDGACAVRSCRLAGIMDIRVRSPSQHGEDIRYLTTTTGNT